MRSEFDALAQVSTLKCKELGMFRSSLRRDIALVLLVKLAILITIKTIWFDAPSTPENGSARVAEYLLDSRDSIPEGGPR
jgi:hypothetical protein